jgi:hypothetical protein
LVLLGLYVIFVFLLKKRGKQPIKLNQKIVFFLYLVGLLLLLNISRIYKQGIVHNQLVALRTDPSSASPVAEILENGTRLNIVGNEDIWLRVFKNNHFYYVNQTNIWLVN